MEVNGRAVDNSQARHDARPPGRGSGNDSAVENVIGPVVLKTQILTFIPKPLQTLQDFGEASAHFRL